MAFNPTRAVSVLRGGGHTETQAQTIVETSHDSQEELSTRAVLREQTAELKMIFAEYKIWTLKLVIAQTVLWVTIAVGAVVVAGVLWG